MKNKIYYVRVGWRKYFDLEHSPRVERFLKANGSKVFNQLLENIEEAIEEGDNEIMILAHKNAGSIVSVKREDYSEVLNHSLKWFLKNEQYEQCAKVRNLLSKLKKKNMESQTSVKKINIETE